MKRMEPINRDARAGVADALAEAGWGQPTGHPRPIGGGCIHGALQWATDRGHTVFVKYNDADCAAMFAAEAAGLAELAAAEGPRVPAPLAQATHAGTAWLALEWLNLTGQGDPGDLGRALAHQHTTTAAAFGWHRDNHLGTTLQPNTWDPEWPRFWREHRLGHQLALAAADGAPRLAERGQRLADALESLLAGYTPPASLLHGDLWAGNYGYTDSGHGVILDPAVYYGDREADLAMTELFGGFPERFYAAYREAWPLEPGYAIRRELYNLYHILNHAHLFGGGYGVQAERMIAALLAEVAA
jgi:fructosamine-3-kinase